MGGVLANWHSARMQRERHKFERSAEWRTATRGALARLNEAAEVLATVVNGAIVTGVAIQSAELTSEFTRSRANAQLYVPSEIWTEEIEPYLAALASAVNYFSPVATTELKQRIGHEQLGDDPDLTKRRAAFVSGLQRTIELIDEAH